MKNRTNRKIRDSLALRNALSIFSLFLIIIIISVSETVFIDDFYLFKAKKDMQKVAQEIAVLDINSKDTMTKLSDIEAENNVYIEIYYPRDRLIYTTETNNSVYEYSEPEELKPRIMKIIDHEDIDEVSYFETRQEYYATANYLVYGTSRDSGIAFEIYLSSDMINANASTALWILSFVNLITLFLILVVFIIYTITVTIPLEKINNIAKKIALMDFSKVSPSFRIRELDELSKNINILSASLDLTMRTLKRRNLQLEAENENNKRLIEKRKQFYANASHELKTPIAIIQGYAEGLKLGIFDSNPEETYDVIIEESQKLNSLVMSLLEVNSIVSSNTKPNYKEFNLKENIDSFIEQMSNITVKKSITVEADINPEYVALADAMLFERVFSNYFSNAVSHCDFEKLIKVSCDIVDGYYRISVFNTGKQIADEDIQNIWNSFYRADKAHSRSEGRFGLGLSIVSGAQELQNLKYGVSNRENGVEFWFDVRIFNPEI